jgi:5-methylcytosine-specific restriction protein B
MAFGQWLGRGHLRVVAVRPDWTGPDALLGYENQLSETKDSAMAWIAPDGLRFMLRAARDSESPYLILLDEMNLAHVERYFADVLSGIESGEAVLPNLKESQGEWRPLPGEESHIPFPSNLFVVGTVNVDETTYMFSPKVLDRANTLEFRVLSSELKTHLSSPIAVEPGDRRLVRRFLEDSKDPWLASSWSNGPSMAEALIELHKLLTRIDREFGHRVFSEALRFGALLERAGEDDWRRALDLQVMQKVLPRFHGSVKQVAEPLNLLGSWCYYGPDVAGPDPNFDPEDEGLIDPALPVSFDKIRRMKRRALANHFVSFAE